MFHIIYICQFNICHILLLKLFRWQRIANNFLESRIQPAGRMLGSPDLRYVVTYVFVCESQKLHSCQIIYRKKKSLSNSPIDMFFKENISRINCFLRREVQTLVEVRCYASSSLLENTIHFFSESVPLQTAYKITQAACPSICDTWNNSTTAERIVNNQYYECTKTYTRFRAHFELISLNIYHSKKYILHIHTLGQKL